MQLASISFVKDVWQNQYQGIDAGFFYDCLICPKFPSEAITLKVLTSWIDVTHPFTYEVRLLDPLGEAIFDFGEEIAAKPEQSRWGYELYSYDVFFWLKRAGEHRIEVVVDGKVIKTRTFDVFAANDQKRHIPSPRDITFGGVLFGLDGDFDQGAPILRWVMTKGGIFKGENLAMLICWDHVSQEWETDIELRDTDMNLIDSEQKLVKPSGYKPYDRYTYLSILHHITDEWKAGINWVIFKWSGGEFKHPILILDPPPESQE